MFRRLDDIKREHFSKYYKKAKKKENTEAKKEKPEVKKVLLTRDILEKIKRLIKSI